MTEHLDLENLASFAARYHLAKRVRDQRQTDDDATVLDLIEAEANALAVDKKAKLAANFARFGNAVAAQRKRYGRHISKDLAKSLQELVVDLELHSCGNCFKHEHQWCQPNEQTYHKVKEKGQCIKPLLKLFEDLRTWVDDLWSDLTLSAEMPSLPVFFATTSRSFHDGQPIIEKFRISGFAWAGRDLDGEHVERGSHYTKVGLEILKNSFGWQQYNVLPYVLLHEILCHAFQSLDNPEIRPNADASDAWSEGWMDCVAFQLALEWLDKGHGKHFNTKDECIDAERQIRELHDARYPKKTAEKGALLPGDGRDIFSSVLNSYGDKYRALGRALHPVTRFSLKLNAVTVPPGQRMRHLLKLQHLAKNENSWEQLHTLIGKVIAADNNRVAVALLQ